MANFFSMRGWQQAIGDPLGINSARDAQRANERNVRNIGKVYEGAQTSLGQTYGRALGTQKKATATLQRGYKSGLLNLAGQGNAARRGIIDRGQQAADTDIAGLENRGVMSGALASMVRRSNVYDVNSALAGIDESIARLASQYEAQGAGAVAGSLGQEAGFLSGQGGQQANLAQGYMGVLGGVQHVGSSGWAGDLARIIGSFPGGGGGT